MTIVPAIMIACILLIHYYKNAPTAATGQNPIVVAINTGNPPMEFRDPETTRLQGFDIDLAAAVGRVSARPVRWVDSTFEQLIPTLMSGRANMIISGFYDIPSRHVLFDFIPYLTTGSQFYTSAEHDDIHTLTDLCGRTVTTIQGTSFAEQAARWSAANCEAHGKPAIKVMWDSDLGQQLSNLREGRSSAALHGQEVVAFIIGLRGGGHFRPIADPISHTTIVAAFRKGDVRNEALFSEALARLRQSNEFMNIADKWNLSSSIK
ncbi:transporter substrate-binding domain-containing protein [Komagataeibacter swingsii]|uniref:Transporter substrate-binding domain-containing protein n=1 Tax=Komagataeibacter swingsii TaxID=215220 RepID=A0A850P4G1_9PROT|nr:transporter substrate-binding domain-containing protein [Komagataeibacter swingsii]NVN35731.1 transporter substrate-binding domain-containing protein [Komagataeibacter swingsii]